MVPHPARWIMKEADRITFHLESDDNPMDVINQIKSHGIKAGIAIKPGTAIESLEPYIEYIDMVLIMTVEPGFGGQTLDNSTYDKISLLRSKYPDLTIQAVGGINESNLRKIIDTGVTSIVMGSAIFNGNSQDNIDRLKKLIV